MFEEFQIEEDNKEITAYAKLKRLSNQTCIHCKSKNIKIKEYKSKTINHKHFTGKQCFIKYKQRRYFCEDCRKTFYEHNPFSFSNENVSAETVLYILDELKSTQSFKSIALKTGLSQKKVVQIFDKYVDIPSLS